MAFFASPYLLFYAIGEVTEKHTQKATIESKGKQITKNGEPDNPAFKVERKGKNPVIKKVWCRCISLGTASLHIVGFVQIISLEADISLLCSAHFPVLLPSRLAECQLQHERCLKECHWHHALHIPGHQHGVLENLLCCCTVSRIAELQRPRAWCLECG